MAPTHPETSPQPLAVETRGTHIENQHQGWVIICDENGSVKQHTEGALEQSVFLRSAAKPFQALPLLKRKLEKKFTTEQLAIACASHTGTDYHCALAQSILDLADLSATSLQCGPHYPLDSETRTQFIQKNITPQAIHNNCSGKHASMLFTCVQAGWDPSQYLEKTHPLQQEIARGIQHYGGLSQPADTAVDGCGAPVFYLPMQAGARLFAALATQKIFQPVVEAMTKHPEIVGGTDRIDSLLMQASGGRLLAKVGADGLIGITHLEKNLGCIIKIADGSELARTVVSVEFLLSLQWLSQEMLSGSVLGTYYQRACLRKNTQEKVVGEIVSRWRKSLN
ncbi:MAG: asparaginase [Cyanobacteria bacterium]|nr:asparaginase [Cyanobacteriota bacterium]